ncbi:MAG: hypothetical protein CXX71_02885 [Methanobacteriota archaeon]|nr:MAG: hypothetical protein CXX71_02885 [Euryarchaeota archaeon]
MTPLEMGLTLFITLLGGGILFWMIQVDTHFRRYSREAVAEREVQSARVSLLVDEVARLSDDCVALLHTQPRLHGLITAHTTITRLEQSLEAGGGRISVREAASDLLVAIRGMLSSHLTDGDFTNPEAEIDEGVLALSARLFDLFDALDLANPHNLGLSSLETRRLGELAHAVGDDSWAESCYREVVERIAPGNLVSMRCLAAISRDAGDLDAEAHWVAEQLAQEPDDEELLRRLSLLHPDTAERNVKRLEALGKATAADHSFITGLKERIQGEAGDQSLAAVEAALEENPTVEQHLLKARLHRRRDEIPLAIDSVHAGLEMSGGRQHGEAWALLAQLLESDPKKLPEALKAAVHAYALEAGGTGIVLLKADLLERSGRPEDALEALEAAVEQTPSNAEIRSHLSQSHLYAGRRQEAWEVLEGAPSWSEPQLHIQKGRLLLSDYDANRDAGHADTDILVKAEGAFRSALDLDRENGLAWLCVARCQRLGGDLGEASISLNRSRRLMDDPLVAAEESLIALDEGRVNDAARLIDEADVSERVSLVVPYVKGLVSARRGHHEEALERFGEVLLADPHHVRARLNRITLYLLMDDVQRALDDCDWLLQTYPNLLLARLRRAEALIQHGIFDEAEADIKNVLAEQPENEVALTRLGACLLAQGRAEEAFIPLNQAMSLAPDYPEATYQRALLYLELGEVDSALTDFETTTRINHRHLDSLLRIAAIHHERDDLQHAESAWRAVLDVDPENKLARRRIEEVRTTIMETA